MDLKGASRFPFRSERREFAKVLRVKPREISPLLFAHVWSPPYVSPHFLSLLPRSAVPIFVNIVQIVRADGEPAATLKEEIVS